ncbi:MAG TPA: DUF4389 domain-containing protein [Chloroflexota bacterium]|nr:DUF4389 domain-containing protein [Chloroflexota bacterium]
MAVDTASPAASGVGTSVIVPDQASYNRFWAVPALGSGIKEIMLIPHLFLLYVIYFWLGIIQLVAWIPVLFTGKYPSWALNHVAGYTRWTLRVSAYMFGLTDKYPPFGYTPDGHPIRFDIEAPEHPNRFWAIPAIGMGVKAIILIPHIVALGVLGAVVGICQLILWIPVLFTGHFPSWGRKLVGGTLAWGVRVAAYAYGLTDKYPPFSMEFAG